MTGANAVGSANPISAQPAQLFPKILKSAGGAAAGRGVSSNISAMGQLVSNLEQLQAKNPTEFQHVVTQIAGQLRTAAQQQGHTQTGQLLGKLADNFQNIASGGSLSQLQQHGLLGHQTYGSNGQPLHALKSATGAAQHAISSISSKVRKTLLG